MPLVEAVHGRVDLEGPQREPRRPQLLGQRDEPVPDPAPAPVGGKVQLCRLVLVQHHHSDDLTTGCLRHPRLVPAHHQVPEAVLDLVVGAGPDHGRQRGGEGPQPDAGRREGVARRRAPQDDPLAALPAHGRISSGTTAVAVISTNCPGYPRQLTPSNVEECGPVLSPDASTTPQTADSAAVSVLTT